jgi:hypothetical protein
MANRAIGEEGERLLVVELFNDFGYGESKWWSSFGSMQKRRRVRRWLISSVRKAGTAQGAVVMRLENGSGGCPRWREEDDA